MTLVHSKICFYRGKSIPSVAKNYRMVPLGFFQKKSEKIRKKRPPRSLGYGKLTHSITRTPVNSDGSSGKTTTTTHSSFTYSYNQNDLVTSLATTRSEITVNSPLSYLYDSTNQLTSATKPEGSGTGTFTYDLSGNRLRRDGETRDSGFSKRNELTDDKTYSYSYDRNGNLTERTHKSTGRITTYTWDYENRLTSVTERISAGTEPTSKVFYKYDAFGRRIQKKVNGTITNYVYDRDNIYLEFDNQSILEAKYTHSDRVDEVLMMERPRSPHTSESFTEQRYYYHHDRLGSVTEITNLRGDVVQRYVYDSFGNPRIYNKDGTAITESSTDYLKNPYTFTGRERDPETELHYHRARYYNPQAGRWISADPIGFDSGDTNFYRYVGNNSINYIDPDGDLPIVAVPLYTGAIVAIVTGSGIIYRGHWKGWKNFVVSGGFAFAGGFFGGVGATTGGVAGAISAITGSLIGSILGGVVTTADLFPDPSPEIPSKPKPPSSPPGPESTPSESKKENKDCD